MTFLCGFCHERVNSTEHGCEIIRSIKDKFNSALIDIQEMFEKRTSGLIHFSVLHLEKQSRDTWQAGMEVQINSIHKVLLELQKEKEEITERKKEDIFLS